VRILEIRAEKGVPSSAGQDHSPLPKGQITIPIAIRRALGITESSLLEVSLEGDRAVISKLDQPTSKSLRVYGSGFIPD
ncbi:MAG TPA: AbrB/MazE/SpoVT family DNA-binding domain-containing protein, partial [Chloroflexota bacterium]